MCDALANGLALEKLADPVAVPDVLFGDRLTLIFQALEALTRENPGMTDPGTHTAPAGVGNHVKERCPT